MTVNRRKFIGAGLLTLSGLVLLPTINVFAGIDKNKLPEGTVRWGMAVDMKVLATEGPKALEEAAAVCHRIHNVPEIEVEAEAVKWIWGEPYEKSFADQKHPYLNEFFLDSLFPVLCNHCDNAPCVRVCPTGATFKREDGIVMMDYHRCIGCRYCMAACPFGARSFNFRDPHPYVKEPNSEYPLRQRGVVEKCNFCAERLAVGKQPACVEANDALVFGDLNDKTSNIWKLLNSRYSIRRRPELGTGPNIYYLV